MAFPERSLDDLISAMRGAYATYIDGADLSDGSDYDISARAVAGLALLYQAQARYATAQVFPSSADGEFLERHASARALAASPAAPAIGFVALDGTAASVQPISSVLETEDGFAYTTDAAAVLTLPGFTGKTVSVMLSRTRIGVHPDVASMAAGDAFTLNGERRVIKDVLTSIDAIDLYPQTPLSADASPGDTITADAGAVVAVTASATGAQGNKRGLDAIEVLSPAVGVTAAAEVLEMSGGGDEEGVEEIRARVVAFDAGAQDAGSSEHIRSIARLTPGVRLADAVVFPGARGLGTVDVYPIGVAGAREVGDSVATLVLAHLTSKLGYHVDVDVNPATPEASETDVLANVTCGRGYEPDWDTTGGIAIAAAPASTTTVVECASSPIAEGIEIGDRVVLTLFVGGRWRGYERTVSAVTATNLTVSEPLPIAPTNADPAVLPGGPIWQALYDALVTFVEDLGPSDRTGLFAFERIPHTSIAWPGYLRVAALSAALLAVEGVTNVALATPVADYFPPIYTRVRLGFPLIVLAKDV